MENKEKRKGRTQRQIQETINGKVRGYRKKRVVVGEGWND